MTNCQIKKSTASRYQWLIFCIMLLGLIMIASLCIGAKPISVSEIYHVLFSNQSGLTSTIIFEGRLPRTLNGLFVGMALGTSGALIQAITRNPLADPGILGISLGASLAVAIAVVFLGATQFSEFFIYAALGSLIASLLIFAIGSLSAGKVDPLKLTLAGIALGAVFAGLSSALTLFNPLAFDQIRFWSVGSLDIRTLSVPLYIAPVVIVGCLLALTITPALNAFGLGDALAATLGSNPIRVQIVGLITITLLCGAATAAAGPIGFVSLMMPHIARWMVGPDQRWIIPFSFILTPCLLLIADIIGRLLVVGELRVSIVTAFIGAPILIYLVRRKGASSL
ncbi:Fe(3+)-siderophore ABC transporter permease [Psychromonas sp. 14N.309.X.WAT.B.A12]|uniref:Fe(3+)-siderophore ABC transporter permease n=1 Tax=Psychromonas sp. 14N.309.X.WAT.B.A12 TaxID=2998322 RepID=UPI0025B20ECD|nr:Fe(3+)-siderophore ABC transporter permease [Psychromonas sp. 14N.309.X.WAT.B.A12]MDN2662334.1 Fe(3+)-siderophore ABC transporter permease [Psychromonas sp. 14N.309.X.WAT.B.A12]